MVEFIVDELPLVLGAAQEEVVGEGESGERDDQLFHLVDQTVDLVGVARDGFQVGAQKDQELDQRVSHVG